MRLNFQKVIIDNTMSVGHVEWSLEKQGTMLVEGHNLTDASLKSNGSGKSSVLGALFYGIYGHYPNGVKGDAVINRKVGNKSTVQVDFEKGGRNYSIIRKRKPTSLKFFCDGNDLTTNSASNTEKVIQHVVGISEQLFLNAIMFDGTSTDRFALMNDKGRKELFTELLELDVLTETHERAKEDLKAVETEISQTKMRLTNEEQQLTFYEGEEARVARELQVLENNKGIALEALKTAENAFNEMLATGIDNQIAEAQQRVQNILQESAGTQPSSMKEYQALQQAKQQVDTYNRELTGIKQRVATLGTTREQYMQSDICPTCGNNMDEAHKQEELNKVNLQLDECLVQATELVPKLEQAQAVIPQLEQAYQQAQAVEQEYQRAKATITTRVNEANAELTALTMRKTQAESNVERAKMGYDNACNIVANHTSVDTKALIEGATKKVEDTRTHILNLTDKATNLTGVVKVYSDKGVKSHMIDQAVPFLNERISSYLATLTGSTISVKLSTQKALTSGDKSDKIDLQVDNKTGADSYNSLSAGEKRRVDIAISLALQDLVMQKSNLKVNTLFYDEVFENLDEVGCENVIELLKQRLSIADTIFVITHNESLKPLFNNKTTIVKEDGLSRIEVEGGK